MKSSYTGCFLVAVGLVLAACGDEDSTQVAMAGSGGGQEPAPSPDDMPPLGEVPCVENPQTHLEIINACTSFARVRKTPQLTLLQPDGSLPPP
jgi:hypothetical protein